MERSSYRIVIKASAVREIESAGTKVDRQRIVSRIAALATDPRPHGSEKLSGDAERYRVRQGDYRIVYAVDDATSMVQVVKVGHRRDVYR